MLRPDLLAPVENASVRWDRKGGDRWMSMRSLWTRYRSARGPDYDGPFFALVRVPLMRFAIAVASLPDRYRTRGGYRWITSDKVNGTIYHWDRHRPRPEQFQPEGTRARWDRRSWLQVWWEHDVRSG